ncbi:hypothetical protein D3C71_2237990 [compost metagenome]
MQFAVIPECLHPKQQKIFRISIALAGYRKQIDEQAIVAMLGEHHLSKRNN